jgi:hypothetical protein
MIFLILLFMSSFLHAMKKEKNPDNIMAYIDVKRENDTTLSNYIDPLEYEAMMQCVAGTNEWLVPYNEISKDGWMYRYNAWMGNSDLIESMTQQSSACQDQKKLDLVHREMGDTLWLAVGRQKEWIVSGILNNSRLPSNYLPYLCDCIMMYSSCDKDSVLQLIVRELIWHVNKYEQDKLDQYLCEEISLALSDNTIMQLPAIACAAYQGMLRTFEYLKLYVKEENKIATSLKIGQAIQKLFLYPKLSSIHKAYCEQILEQADLMYLEKQRIKTEKPNRKIMQRRKRQKK